MSNNKHESRIYSNSEHPVIFTATSATAVTPSDTTVLSPGNLYVGVGGTIVVMLVGDVTTSTFLNVPDGTFLPITVKMIYATTTDATDMLILR